MQKPLFFVWVFWFGFFSTDVLILFAKRDLRGGKSMHGFTVIVFFLCNACLEDLGFFLGAIAVLFVFKLISVLL